MIDIARQSFTDTIVFTAMEAMEFILHHVEDRDLLGAYDEQSVHDKLKDGQILCRLINALQPGSVRKIHIDNMAFKKMENIGEK